MKRVRTLGTDAHTRARERRMGSTKDSESVRCEEEEDNKGKAQQQQPQQQQNRYIRQTGREIFDASQSGAQSRPLLPRLRSDPLSSSVIHPLARSLESFRKEEGVENREKRLHAIWKRIPHPRRERKQLQQHHAHSGHVNRLDVASTRWVPATTGSAGGQENASLTREKAENLVDMYHDELLRECALEDGDPTEPVTWKDFRKYADYKEAGKYRPFYPYYGYERVELIWNFQSCGTYFMTSLIWTVTVT